MARRRDQLSSLRRVYDSNLEDIALLNLRSERYEPRPNPILPDPRRVAVIYGVRAVNQGPWRGPQDLNVNSVTFRRNNTRTVDIWPIDDLQDAYHETVLARTPLLFRQGDDMNIEFTPRRADQPPQTDNIMLLGRVVEPLGAVVTGDEEIPVPRQVFARARSKTPEQIALKLLMSYLSSEEKESWRKKKEILVPSTIRPAFTYQITPSLVYLLNEKGQRIESFCLVPKEHVPAPDVVLSKYLLLKGNEQKFLSIANRTVLRHPQPAGETLAYGLGILAGAAIELQARRETVDIGTIGLQGGVYQGFTPIDQRALEDAVARYAIANALLDGLAENEAGLFVRDIIPDLDLDNNPNNRRRRTYG